MRSNLILTHIHISFHLPNHNLIKSLLLCSFYRQWNEARRDELACSRMHTTQGFCLWAEPSALFPTPQLHFGATDGLCANKQNISSRDIQSLAVKELYQKLSMYRWGWRKPERSLEKETKEERDGGLCYTLDDFRRYTARNP